MSGLFLKYQPNQFGSAFGQCDISFSDGTDLESAVLISLLSNRRVTKEERLPDDPNRYGWWGDGLATNPIGSKLWTLRRQKMLPTIKARVKQIVEEALEWLVEDGVAKKVDVEVELFDIDRVLIGIDIYQNDGAIVTLNFDNLWNQFN